MLQLFHSSAPIFAVVAFGCAAGRARLVAPEGFATFAAYAFVFAQRLDAAPGRVASAILLSTLAGAVTFPLVAWLVLP